MSELSFDPGFSPHLVLSDYEVCKTSDVDEARLIGKRFLCNNDLKVSGRDASINASMFYRKIGGVGLGRMSYGADVVVEPDVFHDFLLLQMPIRGSEEISIGGERVLCTPKNFGIINSSVKSKIRHSSDTEKLIVRIDQRLIDRCCQQVLGYTINKNVEFSPLMPLDNNLYCEWVQMISWIYGVASMNGSLSSVLTSQIESCLVNVLLSTQINNYSEEIHNDAVLVSPSFIKKVEEYVQENAQKPITINDMAEYSGVSCRSLFNGFKKYKNVTPMRYLKEIRLQKVYEDLKSGQVGRDTVTEIAFKWGFSHLGHFSQDYKRRFYEAPSDTLLR